MKIRKLGFFLRFVVAGFSARWAIEETVGTEPDVNLPLAQAAIFLAVALVFRHLALSAAKLGFSRSGHGRNVARSAGL